MKYRVADRIIHSEFPLPELQPALSGPADWVLEMRPGSVAPAAAKPFHCWTTRHGYRFASFARAGDRLVLRFARTATFVIDSVARRVTGHPIGRSRPSAIRAVLVNQVIPMLLGEERLVLHASAVATPQGAVVFAGPPGFGKSTIATALALRGMPLVTDDFLVVDQRGHVPVALPSHIFPRLWPDSVDAVLPGRRRQFPLVSSRSGKRRVSAGVPLASEPAPIARVFLLSTPPPSDGSERLEMAAAVSGLSAATFIGRIDETAVVRATFDRVATLVSRVPTRRLVPVHAFERLGELCETIRELTSDR